MVKKIIFMFTGLMCLYRLTAQECIATHNDSIEIIFAVDVCPEFNKDGTKGLSKFIKENMREINALENNSRVTVQFRVDTLGYTSEHKIIRSINPELDNEALRISKLLKFEYPATQRGKPVNFIYTLTLDFKRLSFNRMRKRGNVPSQELLSS